MHYGIEERSTQRCCRVPSFHQFSKVGLRWLEATHDTPDFPGNNYMMYSKARWDRKSLQSVSQFNRSRKNTLAGFFFFIKTNIFTLIASIPPHLDFSSEKTAWTHLFLIPAPLMITGEGQTMELAALCRASSTAATYHFHRPADWRAHSQQGTKQETNLD